MKKNEASVSSKAISGCIITFTNSHHSADPSHLSYTAIVNAKATCIDTIPSVTHIIHFLNLDTSSSVLSLIRRRNIR